MFANASWKIVDLSLIVNLDGHLIQTFNQSSPEEKIRKSLVELIGEEKTNFAVTRLMSAVVKDNKTKTKTKTKTKKTSTKQTKKEKLNNNFTADEIADLVKKGIIPANLA